VEYGSSEIQTKKVVYCKPSQKEPNAVHTRDLEYPRIPRTSELHFGQRRPHCTIFCPEMSKKKEYSWSAAWWQVISTPVGLDPGPPDSRFVYAPCLLCSSPSLPVIKIYNTPRNKSKAWEHIGKFLDRSFLTRFQRFQPRFCALAWHSCMHAVTFLPVP